MNEQWTKAVRKVIEHLVANEFAQLETLTKGRRLTAKEMAQAVRDYGRTLILPPEDAYRLMDVVEVSNTVALQWSVGMPLWTREEGRSDLTVEVTLVAEGQDFRIEIDDIHVL